MPVPIIPDMKVGVLLDVYPTLEETLISLAPEFAKLRNPILRKTVAKVATLHQAARIGGLDVRDLVRRLRTAAGQDTENLDEGLAAVDDRAAGAGAPAWFDAAAVEPLIDADAMLASSAHPLGAVRQRLASLPANRILCILSTFRPVPLVDALEQEGFASFTSEEAPGRFRTYFCRRH